MRSLPPLIRSLWSRTLQVFKHSNEKYLFIFTSVQHVLNVRFCLILYSKRTNGEQETQITQFRRSHNNAISWSSSSVLLAVRTAPADSQRTGGGSSFAYQAHCPSPQQCLCTVSQNCSHPISFPHVALPSWVALPLLVRNIRKNQFSLVNTSHNVIVTSSNDSKHYI